MLGNYEPIIDKQLEFMHEKEKSRLGIAHPTMSTCKQKMFFFTNLPSEPRNITIMHSSRIRATRSLSYGQETPGQRPPGQRSPGHRPPGKRPPGHRHSWTETPLDTDPPGHRPLWTQTLLDRNSWTVIPWKETPWKETPLDRDRDILDTDPPGHRPLWTQTLLDRDLSGPRPPDGDTLDRYLAPNFEKLDCF